MPRKPFGLSINAGAEKVDVPDSDPVERRPGARSRGPARLTVQQGRQEAVDPMQMSYVVTEDTFEKDGVKISRTGVEIKSKKKAGKASGKLDPSMLEMGRVLGRGAGGRVVEAVHKQNGRKLAIKMVTLFDRTKRGQLVKEIKALYSCKCKCLVKFFGAFYTEGSISLALEFMDMGGLNIIYRYILKEFCSRFDLPPLIYYNLNIISRWSRQCAAEPRPRGAARRDYVPNAVGPRIPRARAPAAPRHQAAKHLNEQ